MASPNPNPHPNPNLTLNPNPNPNPNPNQERDELEDMLLRDLTADRQTHGITRRLEGMYWCELEALAPTNPSFKAALALAGVLEDCATELVDGLQKYLGTGDNLLYTHHTYCEETRLVLKQNQGNYGALLKSAQARAQAVVALSGGRSAIRQHKILEDDGTPTGLKVSYEEMVVVRQLHKVMGMIKSGAKTMRRMIDLINRLRTAHIDPNDDDDDDETDDDPVGVRVKVRSLTTIDVPLPDRVRFRNTLRHAEETINDPGSPFHLYRAPSLATHVSDNSQAASTAASESASMALVLPDWSTVADLPGRLDKLDHPTQVTLARAMGFKRPRPKYTAKM